MFIMVTLKTKLVFGCMHGKSEKVSCPVQYLYFAFHHSEAVNVKVTHDSCSD